MRSHTFRRRCARTRHVSLFAAAALSSSAHAANRYWIGPDGTSWTNPAFWSTTPAGPGGASVPVTGDYAGVFTTVSKTVDFQGEYTTPGLGTLELAGTGGAVMTLSQDPNSDFAAVLEKIGSTGAGLYIQSGATNSAATILLGVGSTDVGGYSMTSGLLSAGTLIVGDGGVGTFSLADGDVEISKSLFVGALSGSTGTFTASSGTVNVGGSIVIGGSSTSGGQGVLNINGASVSADSIFIRNTANSAINFNSGKLSASTITINGSTPRFNWTSGALAITEDNFFVDTSAGTLVGSSLTLTDSKTLTNLNTFIGLSGQGTITQTGGTQSVGMTLGHFATGAGTYSISDGELDAGDGGMVIGDAGTGNFIHTGGTVTSNFLTIGNASTGVGTYTLSDGTVDIENTVFGESGAGTFIQTGGNSTIGLLLGDAHGSAGYVRLDNGTANLSGTIGHHGVGTFIQNGGYNYGGFTTIGDADGGSGVYTLNAGTLVCDEIDMFTDSPAAGSGTMTINGGNLTVGLVVGQNSFGNVGAYRFNIAGGNADIHELNAGPQFVNFTAGTLSIDGESAIASGGISVSIGDNLPNGLVLGPSQTLNTGLSEVVGLSNGATLTLAGGTNNVGQELDIGSASSGAYLMTAGSASADLVFVGGSSNGQGSTGTLFITGGTFTAAGEIALLTPLSTMTLSAHASTQIFSLRQGTLTVASTGTLDTNVLAFTGGAINVQSGGTLEIDDGGLLIDGNSGLTLSLQSSNTSPATLILNGDVTSTLTNGTAVISSDTTNSQRGKIDLGGSVRTFSVDEGGSDIDMSISAILTDGGLLKTGQGKLQISAPMQLTQGITVNEGTVALVGSQNFSGGITINGGVLSVSADNSLGSTGNALNLFGGTLQFSGSFATSRSINTSNIGGGIDITAGNTITLNSAIAGSAGFFKSGAGTLNLTAASPSVTFLAVNGGVLSLSNNAVMHALGAVEVEPFASFVLDNSTTNNIDRASDTCDFFLDGGTFSFIGASGVNSTETLGSLVPRSGGSTAAVTAGSGGAATVTFSEGFGPRGTGATLNFVLPSVSSHLLLTGNAPGFIGGWATVNGTDFAKYDNTNGVIAFAPGDYTLNAFTPNTHVKLTTSQTTGSVTIQSLNLNTASGVVTVTQAPGTTITLNSGGLLKSGPSIGTISGGLIQSGGPELFTYVNSDGALSISSQITESIASSALVKSGGGTLTLGSGSLDTLGNLYTGMTYVHGGVLELNKAPGANAIPGSLTIDGGTVRLLQSEQIDDTGSVILSAGTFDLNGQSETIHTFHNLGGTLVTNGGTLTIAGSNTMILDGGTTDVGANSVVNVTGLAQISGGDNTIEASATVNVGIKGVAMFTSNGIGPSVVIKPDATKPGVLSLAPNAQVTFTSSTGTANIGGPGAAGILDFQNSVHTFTVNDSSAAVDMTVSADIPNGGITKSGAGVLELSGSNTYSMGTTISNGMIEVASPNALGTGTVTLQGGSLALLSDNASTTFNNAFAGGSATIDLARLTPGTAGRFILGALSLSGGNHLTVAGTDGGTVQFSAASLTGNAVLDGANNIVINGPIAGSTFSLTKTGSGTLTLSGSNSNTLGPVIVNAGDLDLNKTSGAVAVPGPLTIFGPGMAQVLSPGALAAAAPVTLNSAGGQAILNVTNTNTTLGPINFVAGGSITTGSSGTVTLAGDVTVSGLANMSGFSGNVVFASTRTFTVADTSAAIDLNFLPATIFGAGFIKTGPGLMQLGDGNAFVGSITVNAGTLAITSDSSLGDDSNIVTLAGGALESPEPISHTILLTSPGGTIGVPANSELDIGSIGGTGSLTKTDSGTLEFDDTFSPPGAVTVTGGTLVFSSGVSNITGSTLNSGTWIVNNGATLQIPGATITTNHAAVILSGPTSSFPAISHLSSNTGRFTVTAGRTFATSGNLSNTGTVSIGSASLLRVNGTLTSTGTIDMSGGLIIDYSGTSPLPGTESQIITGRAAGAWNGPGISSSAAAAVAADSANFHKTALGFAEASSLGVGSFMGATVDSTSLLLRYTLLGDANLDGQVSITDFNLLAANFNHTAKLWNNGDFNYDGLVNASDFALLASNYGSALTYAAPPLGALVPEPIFELPLLAITLLSRRSRRRGK